MEKGKFKPLLLIFILHFNTIQSKEIERIDEYKLWLEDLRNEKTFGYKSNFGSLMVNKKLNKAQGSLRVTHS